MFLVFVVSPRCMPLMPSRHVVGQSPTIKRCTAGSAAALQPLGTLPASLFPPSRSFLLFVLTYAGRVRPLQGQYNFNLEPQTTPHRRPNGHRLCGSNVQTEAPTVRPAAGASAVSNRISDLSIRGAEERRCRPSPDATCHHARTRTQKGRHCAPIPRSHPSDRDRVSPDGRLKIAPDVNSKRAKKGMTSPLSQVPQARKRAATASPPDRQV